MKRLISATLALSLLGGTAASAADYRYGDQGYNNGYSNQYGGNGYRGHNGNNGAAVVAGVGLLALAAILASQHHRHDRNHEGWYGRGGDSNRWGNSYDRGYGNYYGGYSNNDNRNNYGGYGDNYGGYNRGDDDWDHR